MRVKVSIIIVSFNTKDLLRQCINSICSTITDLSHEIIVVDNASHDGSPEAIEKEFEGIRLIRNSENVGFARATNQAIKVSAGEFLLLLNSDTIMQEGTIQHLVGFIEKNPRVAAVGPKVLNPDGSLQNKGFFFPSLTFSLLILLGINKFFPGKMKRRLFPRHYWDENEVREVDYLEGSCLLLRKEAVDRVGLLPEVYFMYFEEAEWCYLAKKKKYEVWYAPVAEIIHMCSCSPLNDRGTIFEQSMIGFYRRNIGVTKGVAISILSLLASAIDLSVCELFGNDHAKCKDIRAQIGRQINLLGGLIKWD